MNAHNPRHKAQETAEKDLELQKRALAAEARAPETPDKPMQAGAREYPVPPLPRQSLAKPGLEEKLELQPMYDAPFYKGSGKLEGKVALITGGDSGIGRSVAILYAREGADVAIIYLNEHEDAEKTKAMVQDEGGRCLLLSGDMKDNAFCEAAVKETVDRLGRLDILVNNAAFQMHATRLEDISAEQFQHTVDTNLGGYFNMSKAALPYLKEGASIINTGSVVGLQGSEQLIDYSVTKGGIHAFTKSLSASLIPRGIRVNCVAPGPVWTPLNPADRTADQITEFGAKTPMKRPAQPEEISPAFVFLASPQMSSYITGEILPVIGGY